MNFWNGKRALVTGGAGFLGSYVVEKLRGRGRGCGEIFVPRSKDYDLTQLPAVQKLYGNARPDIVIHRAARVRGLLLRFASGTVPLRCAAGIHVGANREHPAEFFYDKDLVSMIARRTGFGGKIVWDTSQPNGQP